jgi:hypothetical protein
MTMGLFTETVTLLLEVRDRLGNTTLVEDRQVPDCGWSPAVQGVTDTAESGTGRTQTITGRTLYPPPNSGIRAVHRVRFEDGTVWEVIGDISPWKSFLTGWYPGDQCELRRVRG